MPATALLEDEDLTGEAVIEPSRLIRPVDALSAAGVETTHGLSWSTDAIYRETRARVSRRVDEGCLVVEMEASALMAIARYRSIPFGEVVMAGDSLADREWQHRGWMTAKSARRQLFASAADAAVALTR